MLNHFRQTAPAVALLICVALLAKGFTGAHGHRHVAGQEHEHSLNAGAGMDSGREHAHNHDGLDFSHAIVPALVSASSGPSGADPFDPHPVALIHEDGHADVVLQALQPSPRKALPDLSLLALLCGAILVLTRTRALVVAVISDPPDTKRADWSLRPPLRGPPSFSVV